jgi:hypothetical protein
VGGAGSTSVKVPAQGFAGSRRHARELETKSLDADQTNGRVRPDHRGLRRDGNSERVDIGSTRRDPERAAAADAHPSIPAHLHSDCASAIRASRRTAPAAGVNHDSIRATVPRVRSPSPQVEID